MGASRGTLPHTRAETARSFIESMRGHRGSMVYHLRTHARERPVSCPHCAYGAFHRGNLNYHLRTHRGGNVFSHVSRELNSFVYALPKVFHGFNATGKKNKSDDIGDNLHKFKSEPTDYESK